MTGQLHVQLAKARGARVIGITRSAEKRAMAEKLGADLTIAGGDDAIAKVRDATEGRGADLTIETTGVMKQLADSIHMTRFGGKVLLFGIYTVKEGALPFYDIYFKEISLISARVAKPEDYTACIDLVERGQVRLGPLVSDVMPLGELKAAIGLLSSDSGQRMKIILEHPSRSHMTIRDSHQHCDRVESSRHLTPTREDTHEEDFDPDAGARDRDHRVRTDPHAPGTSGRLRRGRRTHADEDADQLDRRAAAR